ncbi:hypothetical protein R6Z07F_015971 [Ovis aries]
MARGLSSRPEGAAAPGRRARNLGRSEQTGSARRAGGRSPTPRRPSPEERCPGPRPGSAARARARGRAPSPGLQGAPPPHLRPGPRSRRSRGGTGTEAAAPCRARPRRPEALSLRLQRPAPLARSPVPRPFPLGQPRSPRRAGREAGLRPRLGEKRRREEPGLAWSRQSGRQASPLQRRRCTLPPLRPATRGSPGLPARVPCPHLPAAGQMLRAGPGPTELVRAPAESALSSAPRRPPRAPRPRPEAPPHAPGRPHPPDPDPGPRAPTPSAAPVARATALRGSGARDLAGRPRAPGAAREASPPASLRNQRETRLRAP